MGYFIRFVNSPEHAQSDLERGYSFRLYQFFGSEAEAAESDLVAFYGVDVDDLVSFERNGETVYGFRLAGLCGFGEYDAVEDAEADAVERAGYNGVAWPYAAIYEGDYAGEADAGDGDVFAATALVKVVAL